MYVSHCARACLHASRVMASRNTLRIHASVCARVFVYVCVCTCMFTHIDGRRVFGSYDSNGVVNWNRNNEEMHRYIMNFVYMKWILAGPVPMSIALLGPATVSIALPIASLLCKHSNSLLFEDFSDVAAQE